MSEMYRPKRVGLGMHGVWKSSSFPVRFHVGPPTITQCSRLWHSSSFGLLTHISNCLLKHLHRHTQKCAFLSSQMLLDLASWPPRLVITVLKPSQGSVRNIYQSQYYGASFCRKSCINSLLTMRMEAPSNLSPDRPIVKGLKSSGEGQSPDQYPVHPAAIDNGAHF